MVLILTTYTLHQKFEKKLYYILRKYRMFPFEKQKFISPQDILIKWYEKKTIKTIVEKKVFMGTWLLKKVQI